MHLPTARVRLPDGRVVELHPGDLVGRLASAAACIQDPCVSEAHALVSLRQGSLVLLALRGVIEVGTAKVNEVALVAGLTVRLAAGVELVVQDVDLPVEVFALEGVGARPVVLAAANAVLAGPPLSWVPEPRADAAALIWASGDEWFLRLAEGAQRTVTVGDTFEVGGRTLRLIHSPLRGSGTQSTDVAGRLYPPLRVEVDYETTRVTAPGDRVATFAGRLGRLVYELSQYEAPVDWKTLARAVWPDSIGEELKLQANFYKAIPAIKEALIEAGLRPDLVASHRGQYWLDVRAQEGDTLVDRTR